MPQPVPASTLVSPTGMYSMKRTCSGRSMESFANSRKSWFRLRTATAFTFTGLSPAASAASMPARVSSNRPVRVISWNWSASSVSSEMFTRESPAAFKSSIIRGRSTPLVVMETFSMPSIPVMVSTRSTTPLRTKGSPPVRRTERMPIPAATATNRSISSMRRISSWDIAHTPSSGMQ